MPSPTTILRPNCSRTFVFAFLCFFLAFGCEPQHKDPAPDLAAFDSSLARIDRLSGDSTRATQYIALYDRSDGATRSARFRVLEGKMSALLFYNPVTAPALLPYYYGLATDGSAPTDFRSIGALELASYYAYIAQNPDSADRYMNLWSAIDPHPTDSAMARRQLVSAQRHLLRGQRDSAVAALYLSASLGEKRRDSSTMVAALANMADIYRGMGNHRKAADLAQESFHHFTRKTGDDRKIFLSGALASDYAALGRYDSARIYFRMTEELLARNPPMPPVAYQLYLSEGQMYTTLGRFDSARFYYDRSRELNGLLQDSAGALLLLIDAAPAYAPVRNMDSTMAVMEHAAPRFLAERDLQKAEHAYNSLCQVAETRGDFRAALRYYRLLDSVRGAISDEHGRQAMTEAEARFDTQKKNLTITSQGNELRQRRTLNWLLALATLAALLLAFVFTLRLQLRMSRRETRLRQQFTSSLLTATEEERGRIATELHDGINHDLLGLKNNLGADKASLEVQVDGIINSVRLLSRNLHPVMLDKIGLARSIAHLCEQAMTGGQLFATCDVSYDGQLPPEGELQLYRIIQESLTNILRHAQAVAARIEVAPAGGGLAVTIRDNGTGFDVETQLRSGAAFGLHSIVERARALGGMATITSSSEGTIVHVQIPSAHGKPRHRR